MTSRRERDGTDFFFSNRAHTRWEHFCFRFFFDLSGVQADFFPDYWNKTADFRESLRSFRSSQSTAESVFIWSLQNLLDRPDRPDRTQFQSSDRGRLRRLGRLRSSWQCSHMVVLIVWTLFETTGTIGTIICMETRLYQVRCSKLVPFPLVKIARSFQKRIGFDLLYFYKGLGRKIFAKSYLKRLFVMFCEGKTTKEKCQFFFILSKASHL